MTQITWKSITLFTLIHIIFLSSESVLQYSKYIIRIHLSYLLSDLTEEVFFANFQNNLLPSGEKSLVAKSLVIESVDRHEAGIYICEAKNGVGHKSATASIKLQVLCKFSMPFSATLVHYDRIFKFIFNYFQL